MGKRGEGRGHRRAAKLDQGPRRSVLWVVGPQKSWLPWKCQKIAAQQDFLGEAYNYNSEAASVDRLQAHAKGKYRVR